MSLQQVADAWNRVAETRGALPTLKVQHLHVKTEIIDEPHRAWDEVITLPLREGWLQFQSIVICFTDGKVPDAEPDWGCLLAAEAITKDDQSILVRQNGAGGLSLVIMTDGPGEGAEALLADEVSQLATGRVAQLPGIREPPMLRYRRYWRGDGAGFRPVLAAFIGFSRPKQDRRHAASEQH